MKARRFCSVLALCFCLILSKPFSVLADITTDSNALMTMDLTDEDYGISVMSSVGTVENTINADSIYITVRFFDGNGQQQVAGVKAVKESGRYVFNYSLPEDCVIYDFEIVLNSDLPASGSYNMSFDFSSDFAISYEKPLDVWYRQVFSNAASVQGFLYPESTTYSGDVYFSPYLLQLGNVSNFNINLYPKVSESHNYIGGSFAVRFVKSNLTSGAVVGYDSSTEDYQSDMSSSLSDLSSSVDSMTEDLSSAAENLEYISTSQNLIIQGIDNVIVHISDQLYAFWDQLYNLIHEPTYVKLEEILAALRAIANNSDIYAVVEEVRQSNQKEMANDTANTDKQIANDNVNTDKVTDAVEKHGNFIIDGLKSLFIPSEDYFSSLFDDLNEFFKDRFGFLYTPIDLLVRFIDLIYGSSAEFTGIPFPELKWDGYVLLEAQTVGFDILEVEEFKNVQNILYFLTNLAMIGALIALIHKKFEEVMQN